jgi:phosphodiesterase/alkaline phosphatase D-like protein
MKNLEPLKRYYYKVGDDETGTFSHIKYFKSPPLKVQQLEEVNIAVFGDMGTFAPFGHFVASQIAKDNFIRPFDFVFLTGDIAYAGMNA